MNISFFYLVIFYSFIPLTGDAPLDNEWSIAKEGEGVTISTRKMEDTGYRQIKAEMDVQASIETCINLIGDSKAAPKWMNRMEEFKTLEQVNDSVWYTYGVVNIPWPFKDKDIVSKNKIERREEGGKATIHLNSAPEYLEEKDGRNRIQQSKGKWEFFSQEDGKTHVIYRIYAEPDDFLPAWLVNKVVVSSIHKTLTGMRELLEKRQSNTDL